MRRLVLTAAALALAAGAAFAKPPAKNAAPTIPWVETLEDGMKAAAKSRRPIFLVTLWGTGT